MKKAILFIAIIFMVITGKTQNAEFAKVMGEALDQFKACKNIADYQAVANKFNMMANAEKNEWLPLYYHAHCYIIMSFIEPTDVKKKDAFLDVAEASIEKMLILAPNESEVFALQALLFSGRLMVNPMERGQKYGGMSDVAVSKALKLDPGNPRAKFIKLRGDMGKAQFFGKNPNDYCPAAKDLLATWDQYKVKSPIYPSWGKSQVAEVVKNCK